MHPARRHATARSRKAGSDPKPTVPAFSSVGQDGAHVQRLASFSMHHCYLYCRPLAHTTCHKCQVWSRVQLQAPALGLGSRVQGGGPEARMDQQPATLVSVLLPVVFVSGRPQPRCTSSPIYGQWAQLLPPACIFCRQTIVVTKEVGSKKQLPPQGMLPGRRGRTHARCDSATTPIEPLVMPISLTHKGAQGVSLTWILTRSSLVEVATATPGAYST